MGLDRPAIRSRTEATRIFILPARRTRRTSAIGSTSGESNPRGAKTSRMSGRGMEIEDRQTSTSLTAERSGVREGSQWPGGGASQPFLERAGTRLGRSSERCGIASGAYRKSSRPSEPRAHCRRGPTSRPGRGSTCRSGRWNRPRPGADRPWPNRLQARGGDLPSQDRQVGRPRQEVASNSARLWRATWPGGSKVDAHPLRFREMLGRELESPIYVSTRSRRRAKLRYFFGEPFRLRSVDWIWNRDARPPTRQAHFRTILDLARSRTEP